METTVCNGNQRMHFPSALACSYLIVPSPQSMRLMLRVLTEHIFIFGNWPVFWWNPVEADTLHAAWTPCGAGKQETASALPRSVRLPVVHCGIALNKPFLHPPTTTTLQLFVSKMRSRQTLPPFLTPNWEQKLAWILCNGPTGSNYPRRFLGLKIHLQLLHIHHQSVSRSLQRCRSARCLSRCHGSWWCVSWWRLASLPSVVQSWMHLLPVGNLRPTAERRKRERIKEYIYIKERD